MSAQNPNVSPQPASPQENQPSDADLESQIAARGAAAEAARRRMEKAGTVMERMDHKNALYRDLGNRAVTGRNRVPLTPEVEQRFIDDEGRWIQGRGRIVGDLKPHEFLATDTTHIARDPQDRTRGLELPVPNPDGSPRYASETAEPDSILERFMDSRWQKKATKKGNADIDLFRAERTFGSNKGTDFTTMPRTGFKPNGKARSTLGALAREVFIGATTKGHNKRERAIMKLAITGNTLLGIKAGTLNRWLRGIGLQAKALQELEATNEGRTHQKRMSSHDAKRGKLEIDAMPLKFGNKMRRNGHKRALYHELKNRIATKQIISRPLRNRRRNRAIGRIQTEHQNVARIEDEIADMQEELRNRAAQAWADERRRADEEATRASEQARQQEYESTREERESRYGQRQQSQPNAAPTASPEAEVDAEIAQMRSDGVPDKLIKQRLLRKYHPDNQDTGNEDKAKRVTDLFKRPQGPIGDNS